MTNTKDFDWESLDICIHHKDSPCDRDVFLELQLFNKFKDIYRQQLLQAVEEMKKVRNEKDDDITHLYGGVYNKAIEDLIDLLKAKNYMEGL